MYTSAFSACQNQLRKFQLLQAKGSHVFFIFILSRVAVILISYILSVLPLPSQVTHEELLFCTRVLLSNKPQKFWKIRAGGLGTRTNSISIVNDNLDGEKQFKEDTKICCLPKSLVSRLTSGYKGAWQ